MASNEYNLNNMFDAYFRKKYKPRTKELKKFFKAYEYLCYSMDMDELLAISDVLEIQMNKLISTEKKIFGDLIFVIEK